MDTLYRGTINGVEIEVIGMGGGITAGYQVGGKPKHDFVLINIKLYGYKVCTKNLKSA